MDEAAYVTEAEQTLLANNAVTVQSRIVGRAPLSPSEKALLRDLGTLVDHTSTYTALTCG